MAAQWYEHLFPNDINHPVYSLLSQNIFPVLSFLDCFLWGFLGSRRVFGTILHKKVVILVDTSGSMEPYMNELKKELAALIWDQLYRLGARY